MNSNPGLSPEDREKIKAGLAQCIAAFNDCPTPLEDCDRELLERLVEIQAEVSTLYEGISGVS